MWIWADDVDYQFFFLLISDGVHWRSFNTFFNDVGLSKVNSMTLFANEHVMDRFH